MKNKNQIIEKMVEEYRRELEALSDSELRAQVQMIDNMQLMSDEEWNKIRIGSPWAW